MRCPSKDSKSWPASTLVSWCNSPNISALLEASSLVHWDALDGTLCLLIPPYNWSRLILIEHTSFEHTLKRGSDPGMVTCTERFGFSQSWCWLSFLLCWFCFLFFRVLWSSRKKSFPFHNLSIGTNPPIHRGAAPQEQPPIPFLDNELELEMSHFDSLHFSSYQAPKGYWQNVKPLHLKVLRKKSS